MKISKKHILVFIIIDILIFIFVGYYFYNKPHKNIADSTADIIISDADLFKAFEQDETGAIRKFVTGDPVIELTGIISEISKNADSTATIIIKDTSKYSGDISCTVEKKEQSKFSALKSGDKITIKGQCSGMQELIDKEVIMLRCIIP